MLANTAERVTSGELPDVSQELCSSLEGRSFEHIAELARIMRTRDDVAVEEEEEEEGVEGKKKKKTHKSSNRIKSRKTAPVDEGNTIQFHTEQRLRESLHVGPTFRC